MCETLKDDGTHLNSSVGYPKYFKNVRAAIVSIINFRCMANFVDTHAMWLMCWIYLGYFLLWRGSVKSRFMPKPGLYGMVHKENTIPELWCRQSYSRDNMMCKFLRDLGIYGLVNCSYMAYDFCIKCVIGMQ